MPLGKVRAIKDKVYINLDKYGNMSSASIPIFLSEAVAKGIFKRKYYSVSGFLHGLTWGSAVIKWAHRRGKMLSTELCKLLQIKYQQVRWYGLVATAELRSIQAGFRIIERKCSCEVLRQQILKAKSLTKAFGVNVYFHVCRGGNSAILEEEVKLLQLGQGIRVNIFPN